MMHSTTDEVAEWLRRQTANLLGFAREGSNPFLVELLFLLLQIYYIVTNRLLRHIGINSMTN